MAEVKYEEFPVFLTGRLQASICRVMKSECEVKGVLESDPKFWTWGRATVLHSSTLGGMTFEYGGDDILPDDGLGAFAVIISPPQ